jgi:phosphatidylethanolamine-binding protein (PEBP) family uncharacterized protein
VHGYAFVVYALDVASLGVEGRFTGHDVRQAMTSHVLAEARITGLYTLNPRVGHRIAGALSDAWLADR